jgi:hypothetical protein
MLGWKFIIKKNSKEVQSKLRASISTILWDLPNKNDKSTEIMHGAMSNDNPSIYGRFADKFLLGGL